MGMCHSAQRLLPKRPCEQIAACGLETIPLDLRAN